MFLRCWPNPASSHCKAVASTNVANAIPPVMADQVDLEMKAFELLWVTKSKGCFSYSMAKGKKD